MKTWRFPPQRANEASTLAWGTRMKGFAVCFVLGIVSSILVSVPTVTAGPRHGVTVVTAALCPSRRAAACCGSPAWASPCSLSSIVWETSVLWPGNWSGYLFSPSLHNALMLVDTTLPIMPQLPMFHFSTMFLIGPCRQLKTMFAKERALATVIMGVRSTHT